MWAADLENKDDYTRRVACQNLGMMGAGAAGEAEKIGPLLNDVNFGVQSFCAEALSKMGPAVIPVVTTYLNSDEPFVRVHAAGAIIALEPDNAQARKTLITAYSGLGNADLAKMAKEAILRQEGLLLPELVGLLNHQFLDLRIEAIKTIGRIGEKARDASDSMVQLAQKDKNSKVRKAAMHTLAAIATVEKSQPVFEWAIEEENEPEEEVRDTAAMMLKYIGVRQGSTGMEGVEEAAAEEAKVKAKAKAKKNSGVSITIK